MKLIPILLTALLTATALAEEAETGFVPLFDGKTTQGWVNPYKWGKTEVINGEIHLTAEKKFWLLTEKKYKNFILEGEVHLPEGPANSGFLFRGQLGENGAFGYQAEVDGDPKRGWSGGLHDEARRKWFISPIQGDKKSIAAFRKRAGDTFQRDGWNKYRITCKGDHITIEVNGVITSDVRDDTDAEGFIGIQHHGEKGATYRFRNLRIKELE